MLRASLLVSALCSVGFLQAQALSLTGPVEGFSFDAPTGSFRAVIGSLGNASLGPALVQGVDYGSVAPRQSHALSFQGGRCLVVPDLGSSQMSTVELPGGFPIPEGVAWSGDGSVAILYSRTDNWIQTIRGLPLAAEAGPLWNVSLGGSLSAIAIDFDGKHIAIGVAGEISGVFQIGDDLSSVPLLSLSKPVALAFSDDGSTLYALDGATGELSELNMADLTSHAWALSGLGDAFLVRPARDATHREVIYAAGTSGLVAYDASSHEVIAQVALSSQPTAIEALGQDSYLLGPRSSGDQPLWSFTDAAQPVVYFVPATPLIPEDSGK
jgi:hypothetical protein